MSDYYSETLNTLPLFAQPAARRSDPETSHQAAHNARRFVKGHHRAILDALRAGPAGQTEIARRAGMLPHQCNKRLSELCKEGYVVLTGRKVTNDKGLQEREWKAIS